MSAGYPKEAGGNIGECRGVGALLDTTLGERDRDRTLSRGRWCISAEAGWTAGETVDNAQEANILGDRRRADTLVVAVVGLVGEK